MLAGQNKEMFHTFRGYALLNQEENPLTPSMEDYLEMIYRLSAADGFARLQELSTALNVQPSSATKMVQRLAENNYLVYEKYGVIRLSAKGREIGAYLLERHKILEEFLKIIGTTANILEDTEKIEHNLSRETLTCIMQLVGFFRENPQWLEAYKEYCRKLS
ncbi:MAG: hypothetical protein PWP65_154 [Clostridia bacterium]|nr:hypothetical protein [Clostridia bacterium]